MAAATTRNSISPVEALEGAVSSLERAINYKGSTNEEYIKTVKLAARLTKLSEEIARDTGNASLEDEIFVFASVFK